MEKALRVCHVIETAGGGSGQVVLDLLECGVAAGADTTLIYSPTRAEARFLAALEKLQGSVKIYTLPMRREVGMRDAWDAWRLYRLLRRVGPFDVIHSHSSKAGALARLAGLLMPHAAQVYTPHAFITMSPGSARVYGWVERALSFISDAIICVSMQEKRHASEQLHIAERKLHVVPNGVRLDYPATKSSARPQLGFGDQDYIVGFVGRLVAQKNPRRLIAAFAIAAAQRGDLRLVIVGDGPLRGEVEQELASAGLKERVVILSGRNARDLMPGFDCLLCTSDYESFSLVHLEAFAAGVPVVTTPVMAEEATKPEEEGVLVKDFSPQALAEGVLELAALDAKQRAQLAVDLYQRAADFSTERMFEQTQAVYRKSLVSLKPGLDALK